MRMAVPEHEVYKLAMCTYYANTRKEEKIERKMCFQGTVKCGLGYFIIELGGKKCLLCSDATAMLKEYNTYQHNQTLYPIQYFQLKEKQ